LRCQCFDAAAAELMISLYYYEVDLRFIDEFLLLELLLMQLLLLLLLWRSLCCGCGVKCYRVVVKIEATVLVSLTAVWFFLLGAERKRFVFDRSFRSNR